jgi:hypothetical protein
MKGLYAVVGLGFVALGALAYLGGRATSPPTESEILARFYSHRAEFEQLRDMLLADKDVLWVLDERYVATASAPWGVAPPTGEFTVDRFNEYVALLHKTGGERAYRDRGEHPDVGVVVWHVGWAGDHSHINVCWLNETPRNQVSSLDAYHQDQTVLKSRQGVYRHIEGQWYLWTDW